MEATKKKKGGKKALVIAGVGIGAAIVAIPVILIALVLVLALSIHLLTPLVFPDFFGNARTEYVTPGIYEGLVPQGYAYDEDERVYLQCGYMADGESASRIYVTRETSDGEYSNVGYVELYTADGKPYTGHTGGITSSGGFVWLANDGEGDDNCVWVFSLDEIVDKAMLREEPIILKTSFQPETRAACCFSDGEYLFVGEFNNSEEYCTKDTHAFKVADGEINKALVCAYKLDPSEEIGVEYTDADGEKVLVPKFALSVTDLVQGFTKTPDGFAISTSYGVSFSNVYVYEDVTKFRHDEVLDVNGYAVPVYFLDNDSLTDKITMPPMSEEIFVKDGRLYILFESACQKYIFGNLTRGIHIYSYDLTK